MCRFHLIPWALLQPPAACGLLRSGGMPGSGRSGAKLLAPTWRHSLQGTLRCYSVSKYNASTWAHRAIASRRRSPEQEPGSWPVDWPSIMVN